MNKKEYIKVNRTTIKKRINMNGKFYGFAVGNKVNESNFFDNWCLATEVTFENLEDFEKFDNQITFNIPKELGSRVIYFEYL